MGIKTTLRTRLNARRNADQHTERLFENWLAGEFWRIRYWIAGGFLFLIALFFGAFWILT